MLEQIEVNILFLQHFWNYKMYYDRLLIDYFYKQAYIFLSESRKVRKQERK